jgi:hypothetical protein
MKTALKGKRLLDDEDKENVTAELKDLLLEVYGDCFQKLFKQFITYIQTGGDYFE